LGNGSSGEGEGKAHCRSSPEAVTFREEGEKRAAELRLRRGAGLGNAKEGKERIARGSF